MKGTGTRSTRCDGHWLTPVAFVRPGPAETGVRLTPSWGSPPVGQDPVTVTRMTDSSPEPTVACRDCAAALPANFLRETPRPPCPDCGGVNVDIGMHFTARAEAHAATSYKAFDPRLSRKKGLFAWGVSRRDWFHREGVWANLRRQFNKRQDTYEEVITYADSGESIREVRESLSDHRDRGSARPSSPRTQDPGR